MLLKSLFNLVTAVAVLLSVNSALAQDSTKTVRGAKIEFVETSYDFGSAAQNTTVKHIFKFKNVGSDTLKITQVKTSCGCTAAESSKIIPPQKEGQIEVTYSTGHSSGRVYKTVYVFSNDVTAPQRSISIHGVVAAEKTGESKQ
ncbi:MAG: DUF1573 domain-containing protein [candidate division KSB1 bacterium]|nr:DUF1573 domain-containing protein [candidate division KSB1 bacterium]MDZ7275297.1 DUF1573 domain-containing protein [candidate division KSB1 bacterium]MDZ7287465.1 DUF1573 domain-containing protein [candidate division KSB1 bacterium]MDZ7299579.1 DUF1573 domain-containing protein [candidate division KSB1 bacterium]MDZ7307331.1 DUF1573 domain-containing protein [candidate division KSB1 bacterium]